MGAGFGLTLTFLSCRHPQPSSRGSAMASWPQASGLSPSCRATWAGRLPTVSVDAPLASTGDCRPPHTPRKLDSVLPHPITPRNKWTPHASPTRSASPSFVSVLLLPTSSLSYGHRTQQTGWLRAGLWVLALSNLTSQQRCGSLSQPLMLPPLPSYLCSQSGLPAPSPSHTPPFPLISPTLALYYPSPCP